MRVRMLDDDFSKCEVINRLCIHDLCPKKGEIYEVDVWHKHEGAECESAYELVGFDFTAYGTAIAFNAKRFEVIEEFYPNAWSPMAERISGDGRVEEVKLNMGFTIELPEGSDEIGDWFYEERK